jgi:hypothetical protein
MRIKRTERAAWMDDADAGWPVAADMTVLLRQLEAALDRKAQAGAGGRQAAPVVWDELADLDESWATEPLPPVRVRASIIGARMRAMREPLPVCATSEYVGSEVAASW